MRFAGSLKVTLPSDREVAMARLFDAPRPMVWDAYTRPELLRRWAGGPPGWNLVVCEVDLRVGGAWRWVIAGPGGEQMGLGGVHLEIVAPERLVTTEVFDHPWYEGEAVSRLELAERGDGEQTALTLSVRYASREVRDAVLKSPMEQGVSAGYERLAALLEELRAPLP
jgi:uncharacterized protein YndB with AHSA1/START domain